MISNKTYWKDKDTRAKRAREHTKDMESVQIRFENIYYGGPDRAPAECNNGGSFSTKFMSTDTVSALEQVLRETGMDSKDICVLNFASYRNPGGGFLMGSSAQEECLCHSSNLYNALRECSDFYAWNERNRNRDLYTDRAIYSRNVVFSIGDRYVACNVLTCAAPNYGSALRQGVSMEENNAALEQRIRFIKNIMQEQGVKTAILGAFGCGVFRQDAETVASIFRHTFNRDCGMNVVYAVPSGIHQENNRAFERIMAY